MFAFIKSLFRSNGEVAKFVKAGALVVDVRSREEYQAGHIENSRNIPLRNIKNEIISLKKLNKPIVTVCHSGSRSGMAKSILTAAGIEAYNGGAWTKLNRQIQ